MALTSHVHVMVPELTYGAHTQLGRAAGPWLRALLHLFRHQLLVYGELIQCLLTLLLASSVPRQWSNARAPRTHAYAVHFPARVITTTHGPALLCPDWPR